MPGSYHTRSSPLKGPPFKAIQNFSTRKKIRSSSNTASAKASTGNKSWRHGHRVAQSSPVFQRPALPLSHLHPSFVSDTTTIPELRHRDRSFKFTSHLSSHDDKDELPVHSFASPSLIPSSPPRTPSPTPQPRNRKIKPNSKESGADLLLYLANSPSRSPALSQQTRRIGGNVSIALEPPSTPPFQHTNKDLPSSFLSTPTTSSHHNSINLPLFSTPGQQFNFADFVNVTPSPAQAPWGGRTPGTINNRTIPARTGAARRGLNFDALVPPPTTSTNTGLKTPTTLTSGKGLALELEMEMDLGAKLVPIS